MTKDLETLRQEKALEFAKKKEALRYRLLGLAHGDKGWYKALRALNLAEKHHIGMRRDKVTPEFMHQIEIALYTMTMLNTLLFPIETICAILLHDLSEDYGIAFEEIEQETCARTAHEVDLLTKEFRGIKKDPEVYFGELALSPIASVGKGGDRINNQHSMAGVFKLEKQIAYCEETRTHFFKFLKTARRLFPEQELVYENIKFVLMTQLRVYDSIHAQGVAA